MVSSKPGRYSRPILEAVGLLDLFDDVYGPAGPETEPKAATLKRALEDHPSLRTAMIGDTPQDVQAARANGCAAIAVAWGYGAAEDLLAIEPDALVETPGELVAVIDALGA